MEILIARHGITAGNLRHAHLGRTDEPLCEDGIAALTVCDTTVETVYVSPLCRTQQTAKILYPNARQIVIEAFAEIDFGAFENLNYEDLNGDAAYQSWIDSNCELPCPNGESRAEFCTRTCDAFASLVEEQLAVNARTIHIVAHGGTIMAIGEQFAQPKRSYFDWRVKNGEICRFQTDKALWSQKKLVFNSN